MTIADRLVAVEKNNNAQVKWLGSLVWYTISDCRVTRDTLQTIFQSAGLDGKYLPNEICPRDAFRRATKEAELKRYPIDKDKYLNLLVREVSNDKDQVIRHLVRELVDGQNKRLEYTEIARFTYNGKFEVTELVPLSREEQDAVNRAKTAFGIHCNNYDGRNIREVVVKILDDCKPVSVRPSGGVYFIPQAYQTVVESLYKFARELNQYTINKTGKTSLQYVPVIDALEQRQMVQESLDDQVVSESDRLINEMTEFLKTGNKVTKGVAKSFADRARNLAKLVEEYKEKLNIEVITAETKLEVAKQQAMKILTQIEEEED